MAWSVPAAYPLVCSEGWNHRFCTDLGSRNLSSNPIRSTHECRLEGAHPDCLAKHYDYGSAGLRKVLEKGDVMGAMKTFVEGIIGLAEGLVTTLKILFRKPVTEQYPEY